MFGFELGAEYIHPRLSGFPLRRGTEVQVSKHSTPSSEAVHPSMKSALGGEGKF